MPSPLDMPKRNPSPAALKQIEELLGDNLIDVASLYPSDYVHEQVHEGPPCALCPPVIPKPEPIKNSFVRKPHLTDRPLKNHEGLMALKTNLTYNKNTQEG